MDKLGYDRGLVRYDTQHAIDHQKTRIVRPRVIVYGTLLALLTVGLFVALALRKPVALDVIHDRNTLYRTLETGEIENVYLLKIMNKDADPKEFVVTVGALDPQRDPREYRLDPSSPRFRVASGQVFNAAVRVRRNAWDDRAGLSGQAVRPSEPAAALKFTIAETDNPKLTASSEARFFAPMQ
jgi:polyferredoxin